MTRKRFITAACLSLEIDLQLLGSQQRPTPPLRGTTAVSASGRNWSKVEVHKRRRLLYIQNDPELNVYTTSLADSYSSLQGSMPAKLSDVPRGVCEGVGSARRQSVVGNQNRLTGCFRVFEVPSEYTAQKARRNAEKFIFTQGREYSTMAITPMKKWSSLKY